MYRPMQPGKNWSQYPFFSLSVLAKGFNDRSARMQPATAELQISLLHASPVVVAPDEPGTPVACCA